LAQSSLVSAQEAGAVSGSLDITISIVPFGEAVRIAGRFFSSHWAELPEFHSMRLNPKLRSYNEASQRGIYQCYIARYKDDVAGYAGASISEHRFFDGLFSMLDLIYVLPAYRGKGVAAALIEEMTRHVKLLGATSILYPCPASSGLSHLVKKRKTSIFETVYIEQL
jgi:GNAT superfamily N-acetyltransferase